MKTTKLLASLQRAWRPRPLVWALALAGVATHALVPGDARAAGPLPTGMNVVHGQASVAQSGSQMTVTNSAGAVLNWQTFNIGAANTVRFEQPNAASKVLNRVIGNDPSAIFGTLSSNGQVWLVNPNGVLFGRGARVDVGSLVVSTLNIGNDDWRAGRYSLTGGAENHASIVNQGELLTSTGGRVLLLAGAGGVRNEGLITAPDGQVSLAAGSSIDLVDGQTRNVAVRVQAPQGEVVNLGSLAVGGGRVDLAAAMVNQQGFVRAESLSGSGGQIVLSGSEGVNIAAGSVTSAAGATGGLVQVDGGHGTTILAGEVNVTGSLGQGGEALVLGRQVGLVEGALVDASGAMGGGLVRVGGGLQGQDASVVNARAVFMGQGAQIRADATQQGDGGKIILWSNEATRAYGSLSARGGAAGGDGGFIETSGGWLDAQPASVRADAVSGKAGTWLLDPNDIRIVTSTAPNVNIAGGPNFTTTGNSATLTASSINAALAQGNNVTVTTGTAAPNTEAGDISVFGVGLILPTQVNTPVTLTLTAAGSISVSNSSIVSQNAPLNVTLSAANGTSGFGSIVITDTTITTRGGNINLGGATRAVGPNGTSPRAGAVGVGLDDGDGGLFAGIGVNLRGALFNAGAGRIDIVGQAIGNNVGVGSYGVVIDSGQQGVPSSLIARDIDIYGWVDSNAAEYRRGIQTYTGTVVTATHGLALTGVANSGVYRVDPQQPQGIQPIGVALEGGQFSVTPAAADPTAFMTIDGTVRDALPTGLPNFQDLRMGVYLSLDAGEGTNFLRATNGARVTITGHDLMNSTDGSAAVMLANGSVYDFASAGPVRIDGDTRVYLDADFNAPTAQTFTATAGDLLSFSGSIFGDPGTVTLNGRDIRLSNADITVGVGLVTSVTLNASRNIQMGVSDISPSDSAINVTFNAGTGNSGSGVIEISDSSIRSGGGNITLGGGSTAVGPNITSAQAGALATDGNSQEAGVSIRGSYIDASGGGTLRISGQSTVANGRGTAGVLISGTEGGSQIYATDIDIYGWVDSNAALARTGVLIEGFSQVFAENSLKINGIANSSVFNLGGNVAPIGVHIDGGIVALSLPFQGGGGGVRPAARPGAQTAQGVAAPVVPMALTITGTTNDAAVTDAETAGTRYGVLIDGDATISANYIFDRPATGSAAGRIHITEPSPFPVDRPAVTITGTDQSVNNAVSVKIDTTRADFNDAESLAITGNRRIELLGRMIAPFQGTMDVRAGTTLSLLGLGLEGGPDTATLRGDQFLRASGDINFEWPTLLTLQGAEVRLGDDGAFNALTMGRIRVFTDRYITNQPSLLSAGATGTAIVIAGYNETSGITSLQSTNGPARMDTEEGRWLIYAVDDSIPDAGLNFGFRQYNMTYPAEPTATASLAQNGIVYQQAPVLTLSSPNTIARVYDGTTNVTTTGLTFNLTGFRPGHSDDSDGLGQITLSYAAPGVVTNQLLTVTGYTQPPIVDSGDRPVYGYTTLSTIRGSITPRGLLYIATPETLTPAQLAGHVFGGTVTGFITGETVANATTGTLTFTSPATAQTPPGQHPILGSGLTAANYTFNQGEGNNTALTLLAPPPVHVAPIPEGIPEIDDTRRLYRQALPPLPRGPEGVRALDALQSLHVDPTWLSMAFGELDLSSMSREEIAALLEARRQYKMQILAVGRERLTQDPALADVPACQTARQSETGRCLVSAELLAAIDANGETASINAPGPSAEVPTVAAAAAAQQPLPRPAASPAAPAPVAAAPAAPVPAAVAAAMLPPAVVPLPALPAAQAPTAAPLTTPAVGAAMPSPRPAEPRIPPRVRQAAQPVLVPPPIPNARAVQQASIPQIQRKIAVLVGIDNYVDERIPSLENARRDVDAVARVLEQRLGYETLIVRDAGREAMVGLLNRLALQVRPQDSVVVYYAGHGTVVDGTNQGYWIPATADAERPETWISNRDISKLLGSLRAQQVVLISDSCFSGSLVGDKRIQAGSTTDARLMLQRRATVVMSSGGDEPVADGATGGHSPFSSSLMATLQGLDNWRVGGNVFDKVRDDVTKRLPQTPRYGPARDARHAEGADYLFEQRQLGR